MAYSLNDRGFGFCFAVFCGENTLPIIIPDPHKIIEWSTYAAPHFIFMQNLFQWFQVFAALNKIIRSPEYRYQSVLKYRDQCLGEKTDD
jgi:hypothetical protein